MKDNNTSRNKLTLNFKKGNRDEDKKISNNGLEMLAERQRLLKEAQAKKMAEQRLFVQYRPDREMVLEGQI